MFKSGILIIGAIPKDGVPSTIGGTTILLKGLLDYLDDRNIPHTFIPSNRLPGKINNFLNFLYVIFFSTLNMPKNQIVMVNASVNGAFYLSPAIYWISKLFRCKFVFRKYAGNFEDYFECKSNWTQQWISYKTYFRADLILAETKRLVNFFRNKGCQNVEWFPNARRKVTAEPDKMSFNKRFVFISHVKKSKGIFEIIEAMKGLPQEYSIDVYGPFTDNSCPLSVFHNTRVRYMGVLNPKNVLNTLKEYDVLLLPTYHRGEGYPGIIIEAYSLGMPVIATNWRAIPEIVSEQSGGILIPIKDPESLKDAILSIDNEKFISMKKKVSKSFTRFESDKVNNCLINWLHKLTE